MATQVQYDYLSKLLGITLSPSPPGAGDGAAAAAGSATPGAPEGQTGKGAATDGPPLAATDTEIFFAKDSAALTASDTKSLDAYAAAMAGTTDAITAFGYSSVDGDPTHNARLAADRANAVKQYLVGKGIETARITAEGHGVTGQFGDKDLPSNRRVMLAPKPPAKAAAPAAPPPLPADAPTNPPPIPRLTPEQLEEILGPDKGVPRATVVKALTDFLEQLMQQQGGKSLKLTDTVRFAARALGKGLPNELGIEGKAMGTTTNRVPKELADDIGKLLPDFIPHDNFDNFLKMKPKDTAPPEQFSVAGAIAKVITPAVKKIIGGLPEPLQKKVLDSIQDAIVKGVSSLAEKALDEAGVGGDEKQAILKAIEAAIQEKGGGAPPGGSAQSAPGANAEPPSGGPPPADAAPGGPGGATDGPPLPATDIEIFFAKDSTELTASDTKSLDAYAAAMAATTDAITVTGYASVEGDPTHNARLATDRAKAVQQYLAGKGIPAARIAAKGDGFTAQFGAKDLPSNRRVVLAPKPPAKAAAAPPADEYDPLPTDPPARPGDTPGIPRLTQDQIEKIIGEDKGEPRANVEKELAKYLTDLMKSQGSKVAVRVTDKVRVVANVLAKGTKGEQAVDALVTGQKNGRKPAELAKEIATLLPDYVPRENYNHFLNEKPQDIKEPEKVSVAGAIAKVLTPPIKKAIAWLPETIQKKITDSIEDGIVKGFTKATELLLDQNGVDGATKDAILKAMEAAIKDKGDDGKK